MIFYFGTVTDRAFGCTCTQVWFYPLILAQKIQNYQDGKASKELQQYQYCLAKSRKMLHSIVKQHQETIYASSRLKSVGAKNLKNGLWISKYSSITTATLHFYHGWHFVSSEKPFGCTCTPPHVIFYTLIRRRLLQSGGYGEALCSLQYSGGIFPILLLATIALHYRV